ITNRTIILTGELNQDAVVDSFVVTLGASQAVATITTVDQEVTPIIIADALVTALNNELTDQTTTDNADGTFTISADVAGEAFTVEVETTIVNPIKARVSITQAKPLTEYIVTINGIQTIYTSPIDVLSNSQIANEIVDLINDNSNLNVSATDNLDGSFEIESLTSSPFVLLVSDSIMTKDWGLIVDPLSPSDSVVDDLNAIVVENNDWYALAETTRTQATVEAIAAWVEARTKIFGTASSDLKIINDALGVDLTSVAAKFNIAGYVRSFVMYHQNASIDFPECAWFGRVLPLLPGSE